MAENSGNNTFDFIVVGSGASGCIAANRLSSFSIAEGASKRPVSVLLLERGKPAAETEGGDVVSHGTAFSVAIGNPNLVDHLFTEPEAGLNGRKMINFASKVAGGGTAVNAQMYVRGSPFDYDKWESEHGCSGWSYNALLPLFKSFESFDGGSDEYRGRTGEIKVGRVTVTDAHRVYIDAARANGFPWVDDYNSGDGKRDGVSILQTTAVDDKRQILYDTAIASVLAQRPNLQVRFNATVQRLLIDADKLVTGVEYIDAEGAVRQVFAQREVVLSAGAFGSVKILMLSGVGDAEHLKEVGVPVVLDSPQVGRNLRDHPHIFTAFRAKEILQPTVDLTEVIGFGSFDETFDKHAPDYQLYFFARRDQAPGFFFEAIPELKNHLVIFGAVLNHPKSTGRVSLRSSNPSDPLKVVENYLAEKDDYEAFQKILRLLRKLATSKEFQEKIPCEEFIPRDDPLGIEKGLGTTFHYCSTAKMGADAASPVAPNLAFKGLQGLRVADASVMPTQLSANLQVSCFVIGAKVADIIREEHGLVV